jgi:hypothetical protein
MSFAATRAVAALIDTDPPDLGPLDRWVLHVLADAANDDGRVRLGSTVLGRRTGLLPGNARRHRGRLVKRGYLLREEQKSGRTWAYRVPVQAFVSLSTTRVTTTRVESADPRHSDAAPASPRRGTRVIATRDSSVLPDISPRADPAKVAAIMAAAAAESDRPESFGLYWRKPPDQLAAGDG